MKTIITKRGGGKTTQLIHLSAETGDYIVCHSMDEAARIARIAQEMGLIIQFPLTYSELLNKQFYSKGIKGFLIDNVDMLLQHICRGVPIDAITLSTEQTEP